MEERNKDRTFIMNTAGISSVEFLWGLGLPLVLESTFLQLFLAELGATNLIIGLVPTFIFIGQAFLGVVAAYQTRRFDKKRTLVIIYHLFPSVVILAFGFYLLTAGTFLPSTIYVFFAAYILFNAGIGLTLPVWQNYVVKLFNPEQVLNAYAAMMITQSAGRLISSFLIAGFFSSRDITAESSAALFIMCGILFFIGSFGFFMTKEPYIAVDRRHIDIGFFGYVGGTFKKVLKNKNIVFFLLSDIDMYAVIVVISFYANFAVQYHGISSSVAAGVFVGLNYAGQILSNFVFGTLDYFSMRGKCFAGRICSICGILLIITGTSLPIFLTASVLIGISRATRNLIYAPAIKRISGENDITNYFAAAPILLLPMSVGIPLLSGQLLDSLPVEGMTAYRIVFGVLGALSLLSLFFIGRVDFGTPVVDRTSSGNAP